MLAPAPVAFFLAQFSRPASAAGFQLLIGFLILLLVGGIALLVRAVIDYRREYKAWKREEERLKKREEERAKREAA